MNPTIEDLEIALKICSDKTKKEYPNMDFDWAGLIPTFDNTFKYWCTPLNTTMIARTGGDGVHYSALEISKDISPVIMTVPMNFGHSTKDYNMVLSENISEFISLGSKEGWFPLEQIYYQGEEFIKFYGTRDLIDIVPDLSDGYFIKNLCDHFNVTGKKLDKNRLAELEILYFDKLEFSNEFLNMIKPKE